MIYTPLTNRAMQIAYQAHHGQVDKSGLPYIFHPYHLAEQMEDEYTTCIALLHDVMEDTDVTREELAAEFENLAKQYSMEVEKIKEMVPEAEIKASVENRKAVKVIVDSAVAVAPKAEEKTEE